MHTSHESAAKLELGREVSALLLLLISGEIDLGGTYATSGRSHSAYRGDSSP